MSASNGVPARAPLTPSTIEGVVEAVNERGVRINGEWANVSKFKPIELPPIGAQVRVSIDSKGFIVALEVLDSDARFSPKPQHDTDTRLAVLQAAAHFAATRQDIKSADVLTIARSWERWILEA